MIESDWLLQEELRTRAQVQRVPSDIEVDAAGGVDGVINGRFGFHTSYCNDWPQQWWQVDLAAECSIDRIVVWNRCDERADRIKSLVINISDGKVWQNIYSHDGSVFYGFTDDKPLVVKLGGKKARFVRLALREANYLHLDEVQVFTTDDPSTNIAHRKKATQSSISQRSKTSEKREPIDWLQRTKDSISYCRRLIKERIQSQIDVSKETAELQNLDKLLKQTLDNNQAKELYIEVRRVQRELAFSNPILDFDKILFAKRVPGQYGHMCDQYYGWWSRPGGGIYILKDFKVDNPELHCITSSFSDQGSFLRPMLSYDAKQVLFSWCKHYPDLAGHRDKLNKDNVPEDAFYHIYQMNIDGSNIRKLTSGKYDDFDAKYLPDGRILFLSTRRGRFLQCGPDSAAQTTQKTLQDSYVRCGGGPWRPVAIYTLHAINPDGSAIDALSPFESFEWTPSVANDGSILYSRWDYVDRYNNAFMSMWAINPDGTNSRIVYGNYTWSPHCTFEPRSIPNSNKIIFTASAHHSQTMGSLVLLNPAAGTEGDKPLTRLTPEVAFPEIEAWSKAYYANPWPLSERFYLVTWGKETVSEGTRRIPNGMGLYLFDAAGGGHKELIYRDPLIACATPIPLKSRQRPPVFASSINRKSQQPGVFVLTDVYQGLRKTKRGEIKALRIIATPSKIQPQRNNPTIGFAGAEDPGKLILGTVPVEEDGSAFFKVPAGVAVFFQALDGQGKSVQTMRSLTHVQPGQTLSCGGCHESRNTAPPVSKTILATKRSASRITPGPEGTWPIRFDKLVQPVLNKHCTTCHSPQGKQDAVSKLDLTPEQSYLSLTKYGVPSLIDIVLEPYQKGYSTEGQQPAANSPILKKITSAEGHNNVKLSTEDLARLIVWMDTYGQSKGFYDEQQEKDLMELKDKWSDILIEQREKTADDKDNGKKEIAKKD